MAKITLNKDAVASAVALMCTAAQLPPGSEEEQRYRDQVTAFILALAKNYEREQTYNGLWHEYGLADCANNAKSKSVRLAHHAGNLEHGDGTYTHKYIEDAMDDAIDLVNYGAFCARLVHYTAQDGGLQLNS